MRHSKTAGIAAAVVAVVALMAGTTAGAQEGDLDCGDPGTSPNMPVDPGDPHRLDDDGDGIGCEETGAPGDGSGTGAAPAEPVVAEPQFTG